MSGRLSASLRVGRRCYATIAHSDARRKLIPAGTDLRDPGRRQRVLVPDPVPRHLLAVGRVHGRSSVTRPRATRPRSPPRRCSSARSCCTSSATRSPPAARASRSTGIDLFFFGGVMEMSRDTDTPGKEFFVAVAGPAGDARDRAGRHGGRASRSPARTTFYDAARLGGNAPSDVAIAARLLPRDDERRPAACSTWCRRSRSTAAGSRAPRSGSSPATATAPRGSRAPSGRASRCC